MLNWGENSSKRTSRSTARIHCTAIENCCNDNNIINELNKVEVITPTATASSQILSDSSSSKNAETKSFSKYSKIRERLKDFKRLNYFTTNLQNNNRLSKNFSNNNNKNYNIKKNKNNNNSVEYNKTSEPLLLLPFKEKDNNCVRIQVKSYDNNDDDVNDIYENDDNNSNDDNDNIIQKIKNNEIVENFNGNTITINNCESSFTIDDNDIDDYDDRNYNENPVDCPGEFLEQQQKKFNFKTKDYKDTIRDFLREDWIETESNSQNLSLNKLTSLECHSKSSLEKIKRKKYEKKLYSSNKLLNKENSIKMGTVCSTRVKNHVLPIIEVNHNNGDGCNEINGKVNYPISTTLTANQQNKKIIQSDVGDNNIIQVASIDDDKKLTADFKLLHSVNKSLKNKNSHSSGNLDKVGKTRSSFTQTDSQITSELDNSNNKNCNNKNYNNIQQQQQQHQQQQIEQHNSIVKFLKKDSEQLYSIEMDNILHRSNNALNSVDTDNSNNNNSSYKQNEFNLMSNNNKINNNNSDSDNNQNNNNNNNMSSCNNNNNNNGKPLPVATTRTPLLNNRNSKRNSAPFYCGASASGSSISENSSGNTNNNNRSFLKNLSGSVQNLVYGSNSNYGKVDRLKSFSENNLSKIFHKRSQYNNNSNSNNNNNNKDKYLSNTKIDYCPSVLYNRKQIAENKAIKESRKINLKNFKKMFTNNLPGLKKPLQKSHTIQDSDGGFFEKFGSLLRQKSLIEENQLSTPLAALTEELSEIDEKEGDYEEGERDENEEEIREKLFTRNSRAFPMEHENDSGTDTLPDSDSDIDDPETKKQELIEAADMNIEELYEEVLHEILHNIGCETSDDVSQPALLEFIQDAFKITNDVHEKILKTAETKEPPEIRLNVEIIKAENLIPKDSNGLSDPFVTMYLESFSTHRYNTSVKSATLSPIWEEHFSLPIPDSPNNEVLILEVWDFDAAETVGEKMNKVFEVKGIKGFRKLMKEIAVTASTGKHDNELIGRTSIPLKSIPASGIRVWYSLEKNGKASKNRGSVLIYMSFSAEKNNRVAAQEHRHLLKILLMHELETSQVAQYWWRGKFSAQAEAVITQHSAQSGLSATDCAMAQWSVYAQINQKHHLAFVLFNSLLDKIIPTLQTLPNDDDEVKLFWEGAKRLLPSCFSIIRKLRQKHFGDKHGIKILVEVLDIMSKIAMLEPPPETDLLPKNIYGWIVRDPNDTSPNWDLRGALRDSVNAGALEWFEHVNEVSNCRKGNEEDQLQHLIKLTQLIRTDLQQAIEYYDRIFTQKMHFNYAQTLYLFYEKNLAEFSQSIVEDVCKNIKRINVSEDRWEKLPENEEINMGTTLFELYLVLKRFTTLGSALCPGSNELTINKYHDWFTTGVSHWLDISVYKALIRIEKAIDLDKLIPVDETVKYSSSAVDTLAIFYQIKIFWQQLGWPDAEGAYIFVSKIVDDICRCCVFYADRMSKRVEEIHLIESKDRFEVTREWCLAINNIDYIRQSLTPFIKELGADEIIVKLGECRTDLEAQRCSATIKNVIENAIDTERNKIIELIEEVARKMSPAMRRFLTEGAEVLHEDSNSMDRLMMYLESALATLHAELNEVNFERILEAIWCEISMILYELIQSNLDKRRPPSFFSNLRDTLHVMVNSFKLTNTCSNSCSTDKETLENIERLLELHAYETAELIHQYYLVRLEDQKKMQEFPYGQLTVRGHFVGNILHLEIMNARNLVPMDSDGTCDSFVKVHFMPTDKFLGVATPKTSTQSKTLYPLYDEKFTIVLSNDQRKLSRSILVFSIKDKDLFGMSNQYIAEAYLTLGDFESTPDEQILLGLSRPEYKDTDCLRALEHRQGDKQAKDFLKKLKQKAY